MRGTGDTQSSAEWGPALCGVCFWHGGSCASWYHPLPCGVLGVKRERPLILASYPSGPSWCLKGWRGGLPLLCPGSETLGSVSLAPTHPGEQRAWL